MLLSVVVPVLNEERSIERFYSRLNEAVRKAPVRLEMVFIDDGSVDGTPAMLKKLRATDSRVKIVTLSRNFGKDIALTAGLDFAQGDLIVPIDIDLQDPPELIPTLIEQQRLGFEVVLAKRRHRDGETFMKLLTAKLFYKTIGYVTRIRIPEDVGDFRLFTRPVLESLKQLPERHRFMKGLFAWVGYSQTTVEYDREPRTVGQSKWNYWKLWNFAIEGVTSFSSLPLRIWTYVGVLIAVSAFSYAIVLIVKTLIFGIDVPGYASTTVILLFASGLQLFSLGLIGEYIGRIFEESKQRPLYIISELEGLSRERKP